MANIYLAASCGPFVARKRTLKLVLMAMGVVALGTIASMMTVTDTPEMTAAYDFSGIANFTGDFNSSAEQVGAEHSATILFTRCPPYLSKRSWHFWIQSSPLSATRDHTYEYLI